MILHRIGSFTNFKKKSIFVSSSTDYNLVKEKFYKPNGIIITHWNPFVSKLAIGSIKYYFEHIIYPEQKEFSSEMAVFPHYILSFEYQGKKYFNKYIKKCTDIDFTVRNGFLINQNNFEENLSLKTNFQSSIETDDFEKFTEAKIL